MIRPTNTINVDADTYSANIVDGSEMLFVTINVSNSSINPIKSIGTINHLIIQWLSKNFDIFLDDFLILSNLCRQST